jgi:precorrin-2 methylase
VRVVSGVPTAAAHWVDATMAVTVTDERLTVTSAPGARNNKICFIQVS